MRTDRRGVDRRGLRVERRGSSYHSEELGELALPKGWKMLEMGVVCASKADEAVASKVKQGPHWVVSEPTAMGGTLRVGIAAPAEAIENARAELAAEQERKEAEKTAKERPLTEEEQAHLVPLAEFIAADDRRPSLLTRELLSAPFEAMEGHILGSPAEQRPRRLARTHTFINSCANALRQGKFSRRLLAAHGFTTEADHEELQRAAETWAGLGEKQRWEAAARIALHVAMLDRLLTC